MLEKPLFLPKGRAPKRCFKEFYSIFSLMRKVKQYRCYNSHHHNQRLNYFLITIHYKPFLAYQLLLHTDINASKPLIQKYLPWVLLQ